MRGVWRWRWPTIAVVLVPIMTVDLALFGANSLKIPTGGWFPMAIGIVMFTIMTTWRTGRRLVLAQLESETMPLATFLATCDEDAGGPRLRHRGLSDHPYRTRAPDPAAEPQAQQGAAPDGAARPRLDRQCSAGRRSGPDQGAPLGRGFWQIDAHFGFAQTPNVPRELCRAEIPGLDLDPDKISFFVGRANVKSTARPGMARWRERLYIVLTRLATRSTAVLPDPSRPRHRTRRRGRDLRCHGVYRRHRRGRLAM